MAWEDSLTLIQLLDDTPLEGEFGVRRLLGPSRHARIVNNASLGDALEAAHSACQAWGGGCDPLIPMKQGDLSLTPPWDDFLAEAEVEILEYRRIGQSDASLKSGLAVGVKARIDANLKASLKDYAHLVLDEARAQYLLPVLLGRDRRPDEWPTVSVPEVPQNDPWFVAYLATLGSWPRKIDEFIVQISRFRTDVEFSDIISTQYDSKFATGPSDLLNRLRTPGVMPPVMCSILLLAPQRAPLASQFDEAPILPSPHPIAREHGPNVVVIYKPDSVDDLCLLWNLRSAHGLPRGLPLGIPVTVDAPEVLHEWFAANAMQAGDSDHPPVHW